MRQHLVTLFVFVVILIVHSGIVLVDGLRCDRAPEGSSANKSPPDGRFRLRILGDPDRYIPGENYTINLEGILRAAYSPHKFQGFFLTAEKDYSDVRNLGFKASGFGTTNEVGTFHIASNAVSKFSDKCPNLVTHTSSLPKSEVQVIWTAPLSGNGCIVFRATLIEHRDIWYMDDGPFSKSLCEDEADSVDTQPSILTECRACDEAKYELTFEGLWSRHTHPKDFPSNGWLTRFSDVIGASHTYDYRFWEYGKPASEGLRQVAEFGSTRMLEGELKAESEHIRTIIKARGISFPNVTGKTFAVFRVDSKHHLVSLVSMIDPSPDWIVGVSGLELCLANGSWIEEKILNLYPWDAGTDSGSTYISPDQPTHPRDVIRRIKPNFPNDPRSPFFDNENLEMKPLARLYLSRQRLYEKNCENNDNDEEAVQKSCEIGPWGPWSACDKQCGKGKKLRQRSFINPMAYQLGCKDNVLTERRNCTGAQENCDDLVIDEDRPSAPDADCALTKYTSWSECSEQCGKGHQTRTRRYKKKGHSSKCINGTPNPPLLQESRGCDGVNCSGDINDNSPGTRDMNFRTACKMTKWTTYSPCNAKCGMGIQIRIRLPLDEKANLMDHHRRAVRYYNRKNKQSMNNADNSNDRDSEDEDDDFLENRLGFGSKDPNDPCHSEETVEQIACGHNNPECDYRLPPFCLLEPRVGTCRDKIENRWYYDTRTHDCAVFTYLGCNGNDNNFLSRELCLQSCQRSTMGSMPALNLIDYNRIERIDCEVTHWKKGPCNATCGNGSRWKSRSITKYPSNGGTPCPKRLARLEDCFVECDNPPPIVSITSPHHHQHRTNHHKHGIECLYSGWSAWSPCSRSCGDNAVQIRTRTVLNHAHLHLCTERLEERRCDVMPCLNHRPYNS